MLARTLVLASLLLVAPVAAVARAEDKPAAPAMKKIDNPTYASWAKFKVGTSTTYVTETDVAGQASKMTMTHKLVELTAEKAVIETTMKTEAAGQSFDMPAQRRDEPKTIEVPAVTDPNQPKPDVKEGKGDMTTPAGTFSCKWVETTVAMKGMTTTSRVWQSDDVPGNMVKMESTTSVEGMGPQKSTMTLTELKK
jgi:hypothetical protein